MKTLRSPFLYSTLALSLVGCVESFAPASQIKDLRVLAIRADKPEANPGETVQLDALIADPTGLITPPGIIWLACFPKLIGGVDACASGEAPQTPIGFGASSITFDMPPQCDGTNADNCVDLLPEGDPNGQGTVLLTMVACTSLSLDDCFQCDEDGACTFGSEGVEVEIALKRVIVSNRLDAERNHNPDLTDVFASATGSDFTLLSEGASTPLDVCSGLTLRAQADPDTAETFTELQFGEPVEITEGLETSFFVTEGQVSSDRIFNGVGDGVAPGVADNNYSLIVGEPDPAGDVSLFFVLRDDRGGADFAARTITPTASCP
jgi:hypothetical protein